ncbi:triacylglycerol lipase [Oscillatoria sp. HE19RPO]|uniref:esterase/lipase family protein n=1 Tax=Oscillatoria sp. HE19RPO TaxID=2954806 RepID=UPI0020C594F6|nr:alpha/beta fold hydrolase [Oscillatoria sp. HE19RPO]
MNKHNPKNPVMLVHGIWDTRDIFNKIYPTLTELGWSVYSLNLIPNDSSVGLDRLAEQLRDFIEQTLGGDRPFDLIGFSMGGIVSRYYLQRLGGIERVERFISISAPNQGTVTAYALPLPGCLQMRPKSPFLEDLNRDAVEMLGRVNYTSIWTPYDSMIIPAKSSQLPVGKEVILPVLVHRWMVSDRRCLQVIAETLSEPLRVNPEVS